MCSEPPTKRSEADPVHPQEEPPPKLAGFFVVSVSIKVSEKDSFKNAPLLTLAGLLQLTKGKPKHLVV